MRKNIHETIIAHQTRFQVAIGRQAEARAVHAELGIVHGPDYLDLAFGQDILLACMH